MSYQYSSLRVHVVLYQVCVNYVCNYNYKMGDKRRLYWKPFHILEFIQMVILYGNYYCMINVQHQMLRE